MNRLRRQLWLYPTFALVVVMLCFPVGAAGNRQPFITGFADPLFQSSDPAVRALWFDRALDTRAGIVRIGIPWRGVAPSTRPAGFDPTNPSDPAYQWENADAAVRDAAAHGLRILVLTSGAPKWAEGADAPPDVHPGTWKPSPLEFGRFARALATRYSGRFPDPLHPGQTLPRVGFFEVWAEPNLDYYLAPQYQGGKLFMPGWYRTMLNRFYAGIKRARSGALVVAPGTSPFGDPPGGERTPPVTFLRSMLCLRGGALKPVSCPDPAHFDVLSHHPIAIGSPLESATSPLDVTTPDLGRLTQVLDKAEQTHRVRPAGAKPLWVTEFWYDSDPPDPHGVPLYRQARWYAQDLYLFWRQGASAAITLQIRDAAPGKGYEYTNQSGVFFLDGSPKPSQTAFRFPFVAQRLGRDEVLVWGIAPRPGRVRVQARCGGQWCTLVSLKARGPSRPFTQRLTLRRSTRLRAKLGDEQSLTWRQQ